MEHPPFEDIFPIQDGDFRASYVCLPQGTLFFKGPLNRKCEQKTHGGTITPKVPGLACWQWCWRVYCLILVGPWSSWRMHGVVKPLGGPTSRGGRNLMGEKGIQKLDLWQSCEVFFWQKNSQFFFFERSFQTRGQVVWESLVLMAN